IRGAYGDATGLIFLIGAGAALVSLIAVALIEEVPLRSTISLTTEPATSVAGEAAGGVTAPVTDTVGPRRRLDEPIGAGSR
ncbi:MAG TPA: hypothetical protein VFR88_09960, partial [Microlunatus sp.]|nr:hypothetical protein [Microlunatus sp.]